MDDYHDYARAIEGQPLPLAYCDLDRFDRNARELASRSGGKPIRVASKSVRCRALLDRALRTRGYAGVLCFAALEAAALAARGFDDLLVAYPTVQPSAVNAVLDQVKRGRRIALTVDEPEQVDRLAELARTRGAELELCMDIDMSTELPGLWFGVRRSPLRTPEQAVRLAQHIVRSGSVRLVGLLAYEAQIAGLQDAVPGRKAFNALVRVLKRRSFREITERRAAVVDALGREGFELRFVNGGGTGSVAHTATDPSVTELSAGSGLYAPALFDGYRDYHPAPAAGFALEVVRRPAPGIVTCLGGGYVASGAAGADKLPTVHLPAGARLLPPEGAGEVQTPVAYEGPIALGVGDPVFFRHAKAGELCERFTELTLIQQGRVVDRAPTYRGDGHALL